MSHRGSAGSGACVSHATSPRIDQYNRRTDLRGIRLPTLVLLPVAPCIPYRATLVTSPVRVARDDSRQRPEFGRSAFRALRRFQCAIVRVRCGSFRAAFKGHDRDSRARMISAIVSSGRCTQVNTLSNATHNPIRSKEKTWTADMKPSQMALVRADRTIRTQKSR